MRLFLVLISLGWCACAVALDNLVACPASITCDYEAGKCNVPNGNFILDSSATTEPFEGTQTFDLSKISAWKVDGTLYQFTCAYGYGLYSQITLYTYVNTLVGNNWEYSGFGQQRAECRSPISPEACKGNRTSS